MGRSKVEVIKRFLRLESAGGIVLMAAAALALIVANSPLAEGYNWLLSVHLSVELDGAGIDKALILWINDGLMAIFFLVVGLELKREMLVGELSRADQRVLPFGAAIGGIAVPAAIYAFINYDAQPPTMDGWAIPAATDIAFALGVLAMLGDRVPRSLKTFLLSLAVFDDVAAILIIAMFYTAKISWTAHALALVGTGVLVLLNRRRVMSIVPYLLVGLFLWVCVLKSGVHATVAGVIVGLFIPLHAKEGSRSPAKRLEHVLHPYVAFGILPIFAFANAGVTLSGIGADALTHPITTGIAAGLVIGKPVGVMGCVALLVLARFAALPRQASWKAMFGVSLLSGIGFTMSLFIGALAFAKDWGTRGDYVRLGVLAASLIAAVGGALVLRASLPRKSSS